MADALPPDVGGRACPAARPSCAVTPQSWVECGTRVPRPGAPGMFDVCRRVPQLAGEPCIAPDTAAGLFVGDCAICDCQ